MIELDAGRAQLLADCPRPEPVAVPTAEAAGCVLAEDVVARFAVPPFDNTSLDGYAVRAVDLAGAGPDSPVTLQVLGAVPAGHVATGPVGAGQAWKVMTGAPLPPGADTVVMVEHSSATATDPRDQPGQSVQLFDAPAAGVGVRPAGSDVSAGELVFGAGTVLRAAHLGVLASVGAASVPVWPRLRVGVLMTGDELVCEPRPLQPGEIYESNRAMLTALVSAANCVPIDLGVVGDSVPALRRRLAEAIAECDVIITSGGVSMGDADPVKAALAELGRLNWLQLAIRPAKPFAYGVLDGPTLLLGLPGNPVSSLVSFQLMAAPALRQMMGHPEVLPRLIPAVAAVDFGPPRGDGRTAFLRARARFAADGRLEITPLSKQDSHQLAASAAADALVAVPDGAQPRAGELVQALLLH